LQYNTILPTSVQRRMAQFERSIPTPWANRSIVIHRPHLGTLRVRTMACALGGHTGGGGGCVRSAARENVFLPPGPSNSFTCVTDTPHRFRAYSGNTD
jgi:hypothetical protein